MSQQLMPGLKQIFSTRYLIIPHRYKPSGWSDDDHVSVHQKPEVAGDFVNALGGSAKLNVPVTGGFLKPDAGQLRDLMRRRPK
jgi:hypothetical protein